MKRLEIRDAILYVERWRGWSLLLFGAFCFSLIAAASFGVIHDLAFKAILVIVGLVLGGVAILLAFRARIFVIQASAGTLQVITRVLPGMTRRETHPLSSARAVLETVRNRFGRITQNFWIEIKDGHGWVIGGTYSAHSGERPARQLAQDLRASLCEVNRNLLR